MITYMDVEDYVVHVRFWWMPETRKDPSQHALVGMGSAALAAAVALHP